MFWVIFDSFTQVGKNWVILGGFGYCRLFWIILDIFCVFESPKIWSLVKKWPKWLF